MDCGVMVSNLATQYLQFPPEIENVIFGELGGFYKLDHEKVKENLNANEDDLKAYLGTYFPRSFTEAYRIFENLLSSEYIQNNFKNKKELHILDIGSGTGGNLLGLLWCMKDYFKDFKSKEIHIVSIDGNNIALSYQKKLFKKFFPQIKSVIFKRLIISKDNFRSILRGTTENHELNGKFDIIMTFKLVNELYMGGYEKSRGLYKDITEIISNFINEDGLFILSDVTYKIDDKTELYLPKIMNKEIFFYLKSDTAKLRPIIPLSCAFWHKNCRFPKACFTQKKFSFKIRENLKAHYKFSRSTKISYKVFVHKTIVDRILIKINKQDCYKIANGKTCKRGNYKVHYENPNSADEYEDAFSLDAINKTI